MNAHQIKLVQASWQLVTPLADQVAALFYARLFELDPALRHLFSGDLRAQGRRLVHMIDVAVGALDRLDTVLPAIELLGRRHVAYGVREEHYDTVGLALLWTLEQVLGDAFPGEVWEAWAKTYGYLARAMKTAAYESAAA